MGCFLLNKGKKGLDGAMVAIDDNGGGFRWRRGRRGERKEEGEEGDNMTLRC